MDKTSKRNMVGSAVCFLLSALLGGWGIAVMMLREAWQSRKYHFEVERDDIVRYSIAGAMGYSLQIVAIVVYVYSSLT